MSRMFKSPYLETMIMMIIIAVAYVAMGLISTGIETPPGEVSAGSITLILLGFFLMSFVVALVAVVAGIGGGVLFTPIMLAFTPVDSLIVRATGLVVAMFSGLISTGIFMRQGLANLRICIFCATAYGVGAFVGAKGAIYVAQMLGQMGEGLVRIALGLILLLLACYFIFGGKKIEWPEVKRTDGFTKWLGFSQPYYEESLGKVIDYKLKRSWLLLIVIVVVGMLSGFFGLGAGWAIVPAQNIVMGVPLKVAAANSGVLLGMGDCVAVWPYLLMGAMIPLFAAPWLVGQVIGGIVGALVLIRIKAGFVRIILIGIMFFTCYGLVARGLNTMGLIGEIPTPVTLGIVVVILIAVVRGVVKAVKAG